MDEASSHRRVRLGVPADAAACAAIYAPYVTDTAITGGGDPPSEPV